MALITAEDLDGPPLPNWGHWRRVLQEDPYPVGARIDEVILVDQTAEKVVDRVATFVENLDPLISAAASSNEA